MTVNNVTSPGEQLYLIPIHHTSYIRFNLGDKAHKNNSIYSDRR